MLFRITVIMVALLFFFGSPSAFCAKAKKHLHHKAFSSEREVTVTPVQRQKKTDESPVDDVQQQMDHVISNNHEMETDYLRRIERIRSITAKTEINRKILEGIKTQIPVTPPDPVQRMVQQEKVRLIAEQVRKNYELMKTLQSTRRSSSQ